MTKTSDSVPSSQGSCFFYCSNPFPLIANWMGRKYTNCAKKASQSAGTLKQNVSQNFNTFKTSASANLNTFKEKTCKFNQEIIQKKIVRFIKDNWRALIGFVVAWTVIIGGTGLIYGFSAVAWPLAIGVSCGLGFGLLTGIITKNFLKPDDPKNKPITAWEFFNKWINGLDANGTRAIVTSITVTVTLAAAVFFPIAVGAILGILMGNHLSTKIAYGYDFGNRTHDVNSLHKECQSLLDQVKILSGKLSDLENQQNRSSSDS